jgi:CxxC-x17-CxxC domain-containing protein
MEERYSREGGSRGFHRRDDREPREMHTVKCSECGKEAQVPFKPDGERPVYCRECFAKKRPKRF